MKKDDIEAFLTIIFFYLIIEALGVTCPILYLTGISCAGCGMSRAWLSVLHGDFSAAFHYHPLFWFMIPIVLLFIFRRLFSSRTKNILLITVCSIFIVTYLIRMFVFPNEIVYFRPQSGLIGRILTFLYHYFFQR